MTRRGASLTFALLAACGGRTDGTGPGSNQDAAVPDGEIVADAQPSQDASDDAAGWTQCTAPSGLAVCNGPASCPTSGGSCPDGCFGPPQMTVAACNTKALAGFGSLSCAEMCPDGAVCVQLYGAAPTGAFFCAPYDLGVLFAKNGGSAALRYADMGEWTGDPIPAPNTCPAVPGVQVCGGNCGGCSSGETCTGRSRLHPYGFCAPPNMLGCTRAMPSCNDGRLSCFTYKVEPQVQAKADDYSLCVPTALCNALAAGLPGGGTCTFQ